MFNSRLFLSAALLALTVALPAVGAEITSQESTVTGVTLTVTPDLTDAAIWRFNVVLDTHTQKMRRVGEAALRSFRWPMPE